MAAFYSAAHTGSMSFVCMILASNSHMTNSGQFFVPIVSACLKTQLRRVLLNNQLNLHWRNVPYDWMNNVLARCGVQCLPNTSKLKIIDSHF